MVGLNTLRARLAGLAPPDGSDSESVRRLVTPSAATFGGAAAEVGAGARAAVLVCSRVGCAAPPGAAPLQLCGACKAARYCSAACQKLDWKAHKVKCRKRAAALAAAAAAA